MNYIEDLGVELENGSRIFCLYLPDQQNMNDQDLNIIFDSSTTVIVMRDLNSKYVLWGSKSINTGGRILNDYIASRPMTVLNPRSTATIPYNKKHKSSVIDASITKNTNMTDHLPFTLELSNLEIRTREQTPRLN